MRMLPVRATFAGILKEACELVVFQLRLCVLVISTAGTFSLRCDPALEQHQQGTFSLRRVPAFLMNIVHQEFYLGHQTSQI